MQTTGAGGGGFTFRFPTYEEFIRTRQRDEDEFRSDEAENAVEATPAEESEKRIPEWNFEEFGIAGEESCSDSDSQSADSSQDWMDFTSDALLSESDMEFPVSSVSSSTPADEYDGEKTDDDEKNDSDGNETDDDGNNDSDEGDDDESWSRLEMLWEHQDLIEQLKMEIKKVKTSTGLPTILEESESLKIAEDLKPWKIDNKFQYGYTIAQLHSFYRGYKERMRKFDILNYQKTYAIGCLRLKNPLRSFSCCEKASSPSMASLASWFDRKKPKHNTTDAKFMREIHGDLELIYVGQLCLSWEFLHWQYERALELWESDVHRLCRFSEVANELQRFQVQMQRFLEDEPFRGPRIHNYVESRCASSTVLQVPAIREDRSRKPKIAVSPSSEYAITSDVLVESLEESMRILWKFIQADKKSIASGGKQEKLEDHEDNAISMDLQSDLKKKEKKLRELCKTGNCILKTRFHKSREEDDSYQRLCFFTQVDMRLVRRVLNMKKITKSQFAWCSRKLQNISFADGKMTSDPSFAFFPC